MHQNNAVHPRCVIQDSAGLRVGCMLLMLQHSWNRPAEWATIFSWSSRLQSFVMHHSKLRPAATSIFLQSSTLTVNSFTYLSSVKGSCVASKGFGTLGLFWMPKIPGRHFSGQQHQAPNVILIRPWFKINRRQLQKWLSWTMHHHPSIIDHRSLITAIVYMEWWRHTVHCHYRSVIHRRL